MPLFSYRCCDCNYQFEKIVKDAKTKVVCPNCQRTNNEKLINNFSSSQPSCQSCCGNCSSCSR